MTTMKKLAGMAALSLVVVMVALIAASPAAAQTDPPPDPTPAPRGPYGTGLMSEYHEELHAATAEALGLTVAELDAELAAGKTLVEIAAERGVDIDTVLEARREARAAVIETLVDEGVITRERADWMLERMESRGAMGMGSGPCFGGSPQGMRGPRAGYGHMRGYRFGDGQGPGMSRGFGRGLGRGW